MMYKILSESLSTLDFATLDQQIRGAVADVETIVRTGKIIFVEFVDSQVNDSRKTALQSLDANATIEEIDETFKTGGGS